MFFGSVASIFSREDQTVTEFSELSMEPLQQQEQGSESEHYIPA
jgi:hypothetical protein